jgi:hypothetical protein
LTYMTMKPTSLKERVYQYCENHWSDGRKAIANHFIDENNSKPPIYRYIQCWENTMPVERKKGSGRIARIMTSKNIKRSETMVKDRSGISTRQLVPKFKCDQSYIVKTFKNKTNIECRKKSLVPLRNDDQKLRIRPCCIRMLKKFHGGEFIQNDKSCFTMSHSEMV